MPNISREIIEAAYHRGVEAVIALMKEQAKQISELLKRVEELENQKAKNSRNSDKPPSGDGFGKATKSLRVPSGKQTGGKEGHNLKWVERPNRVIRHEVEACQNCGEGIGEVTGEVVEKVRPQYDTIIRQPQKTHAG